MIPDLLDGFRVVDSYSVRVPTYVKVSSKQQKAVNLNVYRNMHHHHLNTQKKNFAEEVTPLLQGKPRAEKIWIHYEIFAPRRGRVDTMNVGSITDKYFSDTLVEARKIPDDNYEHIVLSSFSFGGVVPVDGHAIATIYILEKEQPMRILLDEQEVHAAVETYVKTLNLPNATGVELTVNDNGDIEAEVLTGEVKPVNKGGRPKGSRNKKKPAPNKEDVTDDAPETGEDDSDGSSDDADSGGSAESESDSEGGKEEAPKSRGKSKGNLFGDEDEESSDSPTPNPEGTSQEEDSTSEAPVIRKPKTSIFDA